MTESSVESWSKIHIGYNEFLDSTLCGGSLPGFAPKVYDSFLLK